MWGPGSKRGGKTSMLQPFSQENVGKWRRHAKQEQKQGLLEDVWGGKTAHAQFSSLKKLVGSVGQLAGSGSLSHPFLLVLVEMHAVCLSRHPLQRAIASLIQGLPDPYRASVVDHVHSTVDTVLAGGWLTSHTHCLQYLEALGENFTLGELALWKQLPLVVKYCVSVIELCYSNNMLTEALFIIALKTFMTVLHKTQSLVCGLLSGEFSFVFPPTDTEAVVSWTMEQGSLSTESRVLCIGGLLAKASAICEDLLKTEFGVPHDLSLTAAMVFVVIILRTKASSEEDCNTAVTDITSKWLRTIGSPLKLFPQLAVCHAILAKLPLSTLLNDAGGDPCLLRLFPIICHLFDSFTETSDRYIAARTLALWTTMAKQCAGLLIEGDGVYETLLPSGPLISLVLRNVWTLWEDPVDGIRYQCKLMFENVIGICQQLQRSASVSPSPFLLSLTDSLLSLSSPTRGKYQLLSTLSHHLPVTTLLLTAPTLPTELLGVMGHQALACHAGELWSRLVKLHFSEEEGATAYWSNIWVDSMVKFMLSAYPLSRQHAIQHCLPVLFECCPDTMDMIRTSLDAIDTPTADAVLTTELACLRCAKNYLANFSWDQSYEKTFIAATHHKDEQIQLSALGLLCESVRTTEPPPPSSLPLLLTFLSLNGATQSPNFRYPIITAVKKLLLRIRDSSYAMRKKYCKSKGPDPHLQITSYQSFLRSLVSQQFGALHPFSSYQRRHMALSVLQLVSSIFHLCTQPPDQNLCVEGHARNDLVISPVFEFPMAVSKDQARRLVYSLRDSYDANRALVVELLSSFPLESHGLQDPAFLKYLSTSFYTCMCSPKAVDCTTASYLLRLLLRAEPTQLSSFLQHHLLGSERHSQTCSDILECLKGASPHWVTVSQLLVILQNQLERAREDLLTASVQDPLYGVMQSIRATLEEAKEMSYDLEVCRATIAKVIELCTEVATVASPVVCNSSPEGFLPGTKSLPTDISHGTPSVKGAGAQSLLLCCWHAMKETSLLMGLLVEWAPIADNPNSLLTFAQVDAIASIFTHQLTEARHRGAFEMAYSGFQKLCQSLWASSCPQFHQMPSLWVSELLESLQSKSMSQLLSITRRSAGLPFYLQAILTSEPGHTGRPCLKETMRTLLSVARAYKNDGDVAPSESTTSDSSSGCIESHSVSVHALNILRALYRDSRLGEYIIPFIPKGVEIAVHGFSAALWPVRNSATLLFSALVMRIFGAKRVQDEHSIENKMTAREFFTRFPSLHGFLQHQLHKAAEEQSGGSKQSTLQPSLFPVLLILSRLYPTTLDEPTSPASLHSFLPLLLKCLSSPVWKTRVLISRAVVPLLTPHNMERVLQDLVKVMTTENQNNLHTALLILQRLVEERRDLLDKSQGVSWLSGWLLENVLKITLGGENNHCSVTRCVYVQLVTHLLQLSPSVESAILSPLLHNMNDVLFGSTNKGMLLQEDILVSSAKLLFTASRCTTNALPHVSDLCRKCLLHQSSAVRQITLQFILDQGLPSIAEELTALVIQLFHTETEEGLLAVLCDILVKQKAQCTRAQEELCKVAMHHVTQPHLRLQLRVSLILFLSSMLEKCSDTEMVLKWLSLVKPYTLPTAPVELRQAVAVGLGTLWRILVEENLLQLVEAYTVLVVSLLQDGDEEVRDDMATSVGIILSSLTHSAEVDINLTSNPSSSSALDSYISCLPLALHRHPHTALTILLTLVDLQSVVLEKENENILFEEDPLNNYMEEMSILRVACTAIEKLIAHHSKFMTETLTRLSQEVQSLATAVMAKLEGSKYAVSFSPWDEPNVFHCLCKVSLLSETVVNGVKKSDCGHQLHLSDFMKIKSNIFVF